MTRKSERELERSIEALDGADEFDAPMRIRIRHKRVDQNGDVVETHSERGFELDRRGPDLTMTDIVVETGWEPDP